MYARMIQRILHSRQDNNTVEQRSKNSQLCPSSPKTIYYSCRYIYLVL